MTLNFSYSHWVPRSFFFVSIRNVFLHKQYVFPFLLFFSRYFLENCFPFPHVSYFSELPSYIHLSIFLTSFALSFQLIHIFDLVFFLGSSRSSCHLMFLINAFFKLFFSWFWNIFFLSIPFPHDFDLSSRSGKYLCSSCFFHSSVLLFSCDPLLMRVLFYRLVTDLLHFPPLFPMFFFFLSGNVLVCCIV